MGIDQYMGILAINEYRDKHNSTIPDKIGMVSGFGFYHIVNPHKWIDLHRCTQFQWGRSCFAFFSGATSSSNRSWVRSINTRTIQVGFIWADSHATSDQLFDWRYMNNDPLFRLDIDEHCPQRLMQARWIGILHFPLHNINISVYMYNVNI